MKVVIVFLVLGFPTALTLSWAFEITPEGIKLESEVEPNESITRRTGRKIVGLTIVVAGVAAGWFAFQHFRLQLTSISPVPARGAAQASDKSIALLPFDNLSRDLDNAYFCESVQDEILTRLAKVAHQKVISRTSRQDFKSWPENLPQIAEQPATSLRSGKTFRQRRQLRVENNS